MLITESFTKTEKKMRGSVRLKRGYVVWLERRNQVYQKKIRFTKKKKKIRFTIFIFFPCVFIKGSCFIFTISFFLKYHIISFYFIFVTRVISYDFGFHFYHFLFYLFSALGLLQNCKYSNYLYLFVWKYYFNGTWTKNYIDGANWLKYGLSNFVRQWNIFFYY